MTRYDFQDGDTVTGRLSKCIYVRGEEWSPALDDTVSQGLKNGIFIDYTPAAGRISYRDEGKDMDVSNKQCIKFSEVKPGDKVFIEGEVEKVKFDMLHFKGSNVMVDFAHGRDALVEAVVSPGVFTEGMVITTKNGVAKATYTVGKTRDDGRVEYFNHELGTPSVADEGFEFNSKYFTRLF